MKQEPENRCNEGRCSAYNFTTELEEFFRGIDITVDALRIDARIRREAIRTALIYGAASGLIELCLVGLTASGVIGALGAFLITYVFIYWKRRTVSSCADAVTNPLGDASM